ncbi:MAG TPA: hypothetical protein VF188_05485 [Longimicrobiales bacterium]
MTVHASDPVASPALAAASKRSRIATLVLARGGVAEVVCITVAAFVVRLIQLDHVPFVDEFNHILAARSLITDGSLSINGGAPYERAWLFTRLVAVCFRLFGESLVVARIPAVVAGAALVGAVFLWVRSVAGRRAAWIAGLLICVGPDAIFLSQLSRFYTLHALLFWLGAVAVYRLLAPAPVRATARSALLIGAAAAFLLALHLQVTTAAGVGGVLLWSALVGGPALLRRLTASRHRVAWFAGIGALTIALAVALIESSIIERAWALFRYADPWAEPYRDNFVLYHYVLLDRYPTLWTLFPAAFVIAAAARPRPALFCATIFTFAFTFHSVAAWKAERYLFYAMPMFFAMEGIAIAEAWTWLRGRLRTLRARTGGFAWRWLDAPEPLLLAGIALFTVGGNGAFIYAYRMLTVDDQDWQISRVIYRGGADWEAALPWLRPVAEESAAVLSSSVLKSLYYLGRVDFDLSVTGPGSWVQKEFDVGQKIPAPMIGRAASVGWVMACNPTGLIVIEEHHWRNPGVVAPPTADFIESHAERIPVPERFGLLAFRWRDGGHAAPGTCPERARVGTIGRTANLR